MVFPAILADCGTVSKCGGGVAGRAAGCARAATAREWGNSGRVCCCCRRGGGTMERRAGCGGEAGFAASWISFQALRHSSRGEGAAGVSGGGPEGCGRRTFSPKFSSSNSGCMPLRFACQFSHSHLMKLPMRKSTTIAIWSGSKSPLRSIGVKASMAQLTVCRLIWRLACPRRSWCAFRCRR